MFDEFSILQVALSQDALVLEPDGVPLNDFAWIQGEVPDAPIPVRQVSGHRAGDLILGGSVAFLIISPRFIEVLQRAKCTGWDVYPIEPAKPLEQLLLGYQGLAVTGRCRIDDARSVRTIVPAPVPGGTSSPIWKGVFFDPKSWDGSDVFISPGRATIFVTERCRAAIHTASLEDVEFMDLPDADNYAPALEAGEFG